MDPYLVLLLEDNASLLNLFSRALMKSGYMVQHAATLSEAQGALERMRFDVFVCDVRIGDGTSLELLRSYRERLRDAGTQIVIMSAEEDYRSVGEEMGIEFFLTKPLVPSTLLGMLKHIRSTTQAGVEDSARLSGVTLTWAGDRRSVEVLVTAPWEWDELYKAIKEITEAVQNSSVPLSIIVDVQHSGATPVNALFHVSQLYMQPQPRLDKIIIIGATEMVRRLFSIAQQVYGGRGDDPHIVFVSTPAEARALLG